MKKLSISLLIVFILSTACDHSFFNSDKKPPAGEIGEILLVIDDDVWLGPVGDSLRVMLESPIYGLPQEEPKFNIKQVAPGVFKDKLKLHRNILQVILDSEDGSAKIEVEDSPWAKSQKVVKLIAPNEDILLQLLQYKKEIILSEFFDAEKSRLLSLFKENKNAKAMNEIKDNFKIDLTIPIGYTVVQNKKDFAWLQQYNQDVRQMIFVYSYPYETDAPLTRKMVINQLDKMTTLHVPGSYKGSHMGIEGLIPPQYKEYSLNGKTTYEIRGLWRMTEGVDGSVAMGGPFVNISQIDEKNHRVVSVDVAAYAPSKPKKRHIMLELEAILSSLKIL